MNWLQILTLVVQDLPAFEQLALETAQIIMAVSHAAALAPAANQAAIAAVSTNNRKPSLSTAALQAANPSVVSGVTGVQGLMPQPKIGG